MDDLLLQKYLRNETSEEELAEVLDWLDASTENQRYLDRLDYISNLNILAGEAQPRVSRRTVSLWKRTAQWSAAAAAALLVCAGVSHYLADRILEYRTRDMMAITAPNGQSMSVTLSDGTTVWLNSGAKLEYPLFSEEIRAILKQAVRKMPKMTRNVFLLSRIRNMTYSEIAAELGISVSHVNFEIRRALNLMRFELKDYLPAVLITLILSSRW